MKMINPLSQAIVPVFLLAGCSSLPIGPSVLVLPGTGKSFEQFRADDMQCRQYAFAQSGGVTPGQVATGSGVGTAAVGTAVGAAAGAALGGGQGAAIGAGSGLLAGTISGSEAARATGYEAQQRYDMGYIQCMYAYGNRVPVSGSFIDEAPYSSGQYPGASYPPPPEMQAPALPPR
ncbi:hypothetical protein [Methylomicrobium sp. Wu6]|uniref:hypothetical protein n=1 Tax=Methylomicrobium sp. Wu6 TaxID=3107928 RepID=UPI002DD63D71|nr:hypothetical protein [Methylomicrobium sp. Wu6]MEC4749004.1 hypothetical protein [Methylomicrobium sp. Wu6]